MLKTDRELIKSLKQLNTKITVDSEWDENTQSELLDLFHSTFPQKSIFNFNFYTYVIKPATVSLLALIFVFISGLGAVYSAKNSLPGQFLYPVKKIAEKTRMTLAFSNTQKNVLRAEILTNRLSEVRIIIKKIELGGAGLESAESELAVLTENFNDDLKTLKQQVAENMPTTESDKTPGKTETYFSDEKLLDTENLNSDGSLPVQDGQEVFAVMPAELESLLADTKALLAEQDLNLAFARIQEMEKIMKSDNTLATQPTIEENKIESGNELAIPSSSSVGSQIKKTTPKQPVVQNPTKDSFQPSTSAVQNSTKTKSDDFQVRIEKDQAPDIGGFVREK